MGRYNYVEPEPEDDRQPEPGQELLCRDCGDTFTFPASEQRLFASLGFKAPIRCHLCRVRKRAGQSGYGSL